MFKGIMGAGIDRGRDTTETIRLKHKGDTFSIKGIKVQLMNYGNLY